MHHAPPHQHGGNLGVDEDLYFNHEYFDATQSDLYGQMDMQSYAGMGTIGSSSSGVKFDLSPRLARLSGGSSGFSLSGGPSGFLSGSGELWLSATGPHHHQQQQQQQQGPFGLVGGPSGGMVASSGHVTVPPPAGYASGCPPSSYPRPIGGTVAGAPGAHFPHNLCQQAAVPCCPPPVQLSATPSPGTDGERRDSDTCCSGQVMVLLYHRTRTTKGWSPINANDEVRVTKDRGKVVKVRAECKCQYTKEDIDVELIDLKAVRAENTRDGIQVMSISVPQQSCSSDTGERVTGVDIEVKLSKICKLLQLRVNINSNYCSCSGTSVEFTTHNSGTKPAPAAKSSPNSSSSRVPTSSTPLTASTSSLSSPVAASPPRPQFVPGVKAFPATPPPPPPQHPPPHFQQGRPQPQAPPSGQLLQQQHHRHQPPHSHTQQQQQQQQQSQPQPIQQQRVGLTHSSSPQSYNSPLADLMQVSDSGLKKRKLEDAGSSPGSAGVVPQELMHMLGSSHQHGETMVINGGLDVEGIVRADAFLQYSDLRLKTEIEDIVDALSIISNIDGHRYRWKADNPKFPERGGQMAIGLIAQEVQKVLPEAVVEDEDGYLSVAYAELIPVLIAAFKQHLESYQNDKQEFKKEFEVLRQEIKDKSNRLSTKDELNRLTRQMNSLLTTVNNHKSDHDIERGEPQSRRPSYARGGADRRHRRTDNNSLWRRFLNYIGRWQQKRQWERERQRQRQRQQ